MDTSRVICGDHMVSAPPLEGLETKVGHVVPKPCLWDPPPLKSLENVAWVSFLVGSVPCTGLSVLLGEVTQPTIPLVQRELAHTGNSRILPHAPLPVADLNLYPPKVCK